MSKFQIIWCILFHRHQQYPRSKKCRKCGLYLRFGAASKHQRKNSKPDNIWKLRSVA